MSTTRTAPAERWPSGSPVAIELRRAARWLTDYRNEMWQQNAHTEWLAGIDAAITHLQERDAKLKAAVRGKR